MVVGTRGRRRKSCDQRNTCAVRENGRICCSLCRGSLRGWFLVFFFSPLPFFIFFLSFFFLFLFTSRPERLRFRDLRFVGGRRRGFPATGSSATLYRPHRRNLSITIAVCCRRSTVTPRHGDQFTERPLGPTSSTSLPSSSADNTRSLQIYTYIYLHVRQPCARVCVAAIYPPRAGTRCDVTVNR